jgi:hypothetical protein
MARTDPTFTGLDVIRIWKKNLTIEEQEQVRCFFIIIEISKNNEERALKLLLALVLKLIPIVGNAVAFVDEVLDLAVELSTLAECLETLKEVT